jgi:transposase-like protein
MMERGRTLSNRTKEEMFSLLAEHASTGQPVKEFCEQKGLSPGMFYYWQKKYKSGLGGDQQAGGFTLLALEGRPEEQTTGCLFAEYKGIRFYQQPSADFFKQLIG